MSSYLVLDCKSISYKYVLNFGYIAPYSLAPHLIPFVPLNSFSFPFFLNYYYLCVYWCPARAQEGLGFPGAGVAGIPKQPNEVLEHGPRDRTESPLTARPWLQLLELAHSAIREEKERPVCLSLDRKQVGGFEAEAFFI